MADSGARKGRGLGGARGAGRGQEGTGAGGNGCMSAWRCRGAEGHRGHGGHGDLEGGSWAKMGACGGVLGGGGGGPIKGAKSRPQKGGQEQALTDKTLRKGGRMARTTQKRGHRRRLEGKYIQKEDGQRQSSRRSSSSRGSRSSRGSSSRCSCSGGSSIK